ncbi:MAG: tryptophan--tRNA ligase [Deltaproteobacteria bacterium]|nr:tryptophan--tRNA ligase [Deltaproteobacteria bacterium]
MSRFLSGVQPSGQPHLGNYFGAIQQHIALQDEGACYYFIADYHALTSVNDADKMRECVRDVAATYLALGLDPERAVFWRQSDVPEVTELTWLLASVTGMGLLERAHSYKDKTAKGIKPNVGLFLYPVLMAADILAYDADFVPVGKDQVQHVEITQDMAGAFNALYGDGVLKRPEWKLSKTPRVVGLDGEKMSKSYGNDVWIFLDGKPLKKRIGKIPTDSRAPDEPKEPEGLIFDWLKLLLPDEEYGDLARRAQEGGENGPGYGELKKRICESIETRFGDARVEYHRLLEHPAEIEAVLQDGATRAGKQAREVRDRCYTACGLR